MLSHEIFQVYGKSFPRPVNPSLILLVSFGRKLIQIQVRLIYYRKLFYFNFLFINFGFEIFISITKLVGCILFWAM